MASETESGDTKSLSGKNVGELSEAALHGVLALRSVTAWRPTIRALGILGIVALGLLGCSGASSDVAAHSADQPSDTTVDEEYRVGRCHAAEVVCDLSEPLIPGAGCFCPSETGETVPGTAGS